ncbi:MAG TPA: hypothetical protein VM925_00755 [Labilithrix sp.]|nr:hypothetical protein [Labilithrix sp.]
MALWSGCGGVEESPASTLRDGGVGGGGADAAGQDSGGITPDSGDTKVLVDAGGQDADASKEVDSGLPPPVTVTYGTCPAFTACGGDVIGTWAVSGGCVSADTFAAAKQPPCEGVQESDVVIKAAGTMVATATTIHRKSKVDMSAKLFIPQACAAQAGGNCALVEYGLTNEIEPGTPPLFDKASCTSAGGGACNCTVSRATAEDETSDYTVAGNTLTSTNPTRTFDYCVDGTKNTYKETTDGSLPIIVELTKK